MSNSRRFLLLGVTLLLLTFSFNVSASQIGFSGTVLDAEGRPIPSARITLFSTGHTDPAASAMSGSDGRFSFDLAPGEYAIVVHKSAFVDTIDTITIWPSTTAEKRLVLNTAALEESITVRAENGYRVASTSSATKTETPLRDVPQSITVITRQLMQDQLMSSIGDVVRYVPGVTLHQGENNRDQIVMRGNSSSADFFVDGVRDDVQYYRDLYNLERVEILKGPNAMIFGRGGAGGVINRVTKGAGFSRLRELDMQVGSYGNRRVALDLDQPLSERFAVRLNGVYEDSDSFRDNVSLKRSGISPTLTFAASDSTTMTAAFEHFRDDRTADRGISSFNGQPADVDISTYYGNPNDSHVRAAVNLAAVSVEHVARTFTIRNRTLFGDYDRGYQNYVPGAVTADKSQVALTAYNNETQRQNFFNQTDVTFRTLRQTILVGGEAGWQFTDNFRNTGFFNGTATSILVPYATPSTTVPVVFRQSATDADNHLRATVTAVYAQDQFELRQWLQLLGGVRLDRFQLEYHNNRNDDRRERCDTLVSPRAGVIVKPSETLSIYGSYSVSFLPGSGDQFSSLTSVTDQLKPERINNYEAGIKWDAMNAFALTLSTYRLDRTNTRSTDPNDPTRIIQTGSQRTNGFELGINGRVTSWWTIAGGYSNQDAFVTSATASASKGAKVAQVPHETFSLWNNYRLHSKVSAGIGIIRRSSMFATIDDSVTLPGYTELDGAFFFSLTKEIRLQVNLENLLDSRYYATADSNTNISPGSRRAVRAGVVARF
jgi:catecholate siderophore receptor